MRRLKTAPAKGGRTSHSTRRKYRLVLKTMSTKKQDAMNRKRFEDSQVASLLELKARIYDPEAAKEARANARTARPIDADEYRASITGHSLFKGLHRVLEEN